MFYKIVKTILNIYFTIFYKVDIKGINNIPKNMGFIITSNHQHIVDPLVLISIFPQKIHWMAKKELFSNKIISNILKKLGAIPVDRENVKMSTLRKSLNILKKNKVLGIFPEGTRVKEIDIKNAKPGVALISIESESPILPIYIESNFKLFKDIKIVIGKSYEFKEEYGKRLTSEDYKKYGEKVLYSIYDLKNYER